MDRGPEFFLLLSFGAGCLALSFKHGREGHLLKSIMFGGGAAFAGFCNVINGGALMGSGLEPMFSFLVALDLPILGVAVSRELYWRARNNS